MSRWCAFLTEDDPAAHVRAVGAEPITAGPITAGSITAGSITAAGPHGFGLLDGPGVAAGPFTAGALTAVGEVTLFNADRLRARLGADAPPPGRPDGEVLLHSYARFGLDGIAAAEGMFALAVADGPDLVLLRDQLGARTLFHARARAGWAASTSLRALRRWPALRTGLHLPAVRSFLTFAYLPGRETLLRDVHEVLPGRCLRLHPDGTSTEHTYWEPREHIDERPASEHALRLRALLEDAVTRRLPAGEPVGVLLSGGIDSGLVTALAAKLHDQAVHTYSISFGADAPDELGYSGLVATHCHTRHRVLTVPGQTVAARLADTVGLLDSPVGDPLTVPNLMLAEAVAADGIRVALNGEGGDPVFGGPKNLPMLIFELTRDDPAEDARAHAYLDSYRKCYADLPTLLTRDALAALADAPGPVEHVAPYLRPGAMTSLLNQLLHTNLRTKGAHHILTKVERLTAASGIEGRAPLFDRAVVDHAFAVPPTMKLAGTSEKWILKQAVRDLLPATIVDRPKSGMRVPVQQWLDGPLRELAHDLLLGRTARERGLFRADTIRAWLRGEGALLPRQGGKLWLVLSLQLWLRSFDLEESVR
ncbi:asparagine synthetase B family protein [Nocardia farcinica]|uniref:asparagine synthetase B family protein n=1 Tax=Nocardia farcinica TaxID=37329 RepID=UPI000BF2AD61|nr:asparagine synthase-related protein [Nocardia farcinica]MBA4854316.1 asparagine synthase [Nocardia farcinica]MBC9814501.1 asparagine synthase [Nocardia farcinica]MBF6249357.1 asparagine synthase [Nocardia farcinica]MBF6376319.1 asparagine synthase [Nocardia farcinica]MBF6445167.1 asparagine synthase [Nocardia farcinica]